MQRRAAGSSQHPAERPPRLHAFLLPPSKNGGPRGGSDRSLGALPFRGADLNSPGLEGRGGARWKTGKPGEPCIIDPPPFGSARPLLEDALRRSRDPAQLTDCCRPACWRSPPSASARTAARKGCEERPRKRVRLEPAVGALSAHSLEGGDRRIAWSS